MSHQVTTFYAPDSDGEARPRLREPEDPLPGPLPPPLLRPAALCGTEVMTMGHLEDCQKGYLTLPWLLSGPRTRGQVGRLSLGVERVC